MFADSLNRKVDILAVARDTRTDSTGHVPSPPGTTSVYRIGYEIKDTLWNVKKSYWEKIRFDTIPDPSNSPQLSLTYGSGSTMSHFRYWVTNDPFNLDSTKRNWFWNTKQKVGEPDSVDADSIEEARFKDGYYWVKTTAWDIRDNTHSDSIRVHVDNFPPRVKETYPPGWFEFVPHRQHTLWCLFSEPMDTTTIIENNISIISLTDSEEYPFSLSYTDSINMLALEVDSFRFIDTIQVRLDSAITDWAGKSIENEGRKTVAYTWTFVVGVLQLTDNEVDDFDPCIYDSIIAWVRSDSPDDSAGYIIKYNLNMQTETQLISDSYSNSPRIYKKIKFFT